MIKLNINLEKGRVIKFAKKGSNKIYRKSGRESKKIFETKNVSDFLFVVKEGENKPPNSKNVCKILMDAKQDSEIKNKVFTNNAYKTGKLFSDYMLNQGKLNLILSPKFLCALYITKEQGLNQKYCNLKVKDHVWPATYLDEGNESAIRTFETILKTKAIDLADIILGQQLGDK